MINKYNKYHDEYICKSYRGNKFHLYSKGIHKVAGSSLVFIRFSCFSSSESLAATPHKSSPGSSSDHRQVLCGLGSGLVVQGTVTQYTISSDGSNPGM